MNQNRIYLDNAATSWPKPEAVYEASDHYLREIGAPNGRSSYGQAMESNRIIERARRGVAELIEAGPGSHVAFGFNCTDVLNMAIRGIVRPGDHIVTTVCDHNSVLRPVRDLAENADCEVTYVPCDGQGFISPDDVRAWTGFNQLGDTAAGALNNAIRLHRLAVAAAAVGRANFAEKVVGGFVNGFRLGPRSGGVVEVDAFLVHGSFIIELTERV